MRPLTYAVGALAGENGRLFAVLGLMRIAELNPDTCALIGGPFGVPGGDFVLGLAFDGTELFAATFMSPAIYVMNPDSGAILRAFHPGFAASGLAASSEAAGSTPVSVGVDFMPNNCANALNVRANPVVAVVVVGTTEQVESEGFDRPSLALPGRQDELVAQVAAANPRTVVVVNAGSPVLLPWADDVAAVLLTWFPGQAAGAALADVLLGVAEPGGRLPTTWPRRAQDCPVLAVDTTGGVVGILHDKTRHHSRLDGIDWT